MKTAGSFKKYIYYLYIKNKWGYRSSTQYNARNVETAH